jgi:hypothetical protein
MHFLVIGNVRSAGPSGTRCGVADADCYCSASLREGLFSAGAFIDQVSPGRFSGSSEPATISIPRLCNHRRRLRRCFWHCWLAECDGF